MNNVVAFPIERDTSNIVHLGVLRGGKQDKKVKYNRDGSINKCHNNKVAGKSSEVYAFRTKDEIKAMIAIFDKHINDASGEVQKRIANRNKLLFLIGMNVGIRASDLRTLRWSFFFDKDADGNLSFKDFYVLQPMKQKKHGKFVKLFFNQTIREAVRNYVSKYPIENLDDYLFLSRKGTDPIEAKYLWQILNDTAIEAGIKQNIGSHSLRKSFGFWVWHNAIDKNKALVMLQQIFSHSSSQTTAKYIGIMDDEIEDMFHSIDLGLEFI